MGRFWVGYRCRLWRVVSVGSKFKKLYAALRELLVWSRYGELVFCCYKAVSGFDMRTCSSNFDRGACYSWESRARSTGAWTWGGGRRLWMLIEGGVWARNGFGLVTAKAVARTLGLSTEEEKGDGSYLLEQARLSTGPVYKEVQLVRRCSMRKWMHGWGWCAELVAVDRLEGSAGLCLEPMTVD